MKTKQFLIINGEGEPMKWEYLVLIWSDGEWDFDSLKGFSRGKALDYYGAKGWELVSVTDSRIVIDRGGDDVASSSREIFYLKRPLS